MRKDLWDNASKYHIVVLKDGEFLTPPKLVNMGIWVCYTCGEINILESNECSNCREPKFFIKMTYKTVNYAKLQSDLSLKLSIEFKHKEFTANDVAEYAVLIADIDLHPYHIAAEIWRFFAMIPNRYLSKDDAKLLVDTATEHYKYKR